MKKVLAVLTAFILLLAGCSSGSSTTDPVVVWAMGDEGNKLSQLTDKYTEETGQAVEVVAIPWDSAYEKLTTAVSSKSGPDIIQMGNTWVTEFGSAGALADLSQFAEGRENFKKELYFDGAQDTIEVNDTPVAVPWYVETRVLYYRTDILEETCGLTTAPKDWDEMVTCSEKLSARGEDQYGISMDIKDGIFFIQYALQNGWSMTDENGKLNVNSKEFTEAVDYVRQFTDKGLTNLDTGLDITQTFADGMFPMFVSGPWMVDVFGEQVPDLEGKYDIAPLPEGPGGSKSVMGGSGLVIFEYSENKEAAADLINWVVAPDTQKEWYSIAGSLPSAKAVWEDAEFISSGFKMDVWQDALSRAESTPNVTYWGPVTDEIIKAQEAVMVEGKETATVLEETQAVIEEKQAK